MLNQKVQAEWIRLIKEEADKLRNQATNTGQLGFLFLKKGIDATAGRRAGPLKVLFSSTAQMLPFYGKTLFSVDLATSDIDFPDSFSLGVDVNGIEIREKTNL